MGTWGAGVFENDAAEDFLDNLSSMDSDSREMFLVGVITPAEESKDSVAPVPNPAETLAAIALVAIGVAGGSVFAGQEDYPGIEDWIRTESLNEFKEVALRVLSSIEHDSDWYWNSWIDEDEKEEALADVAKMRRILSFSV